MYFDLITTKSKNYLIFGGQIIFLSAISSFNSFNIFLNVAKTNLNHMSPYEL